MTFEFYTREILLHHWIVIGIMLECDEINDG